MAAKARGVCSVRFGRPVKNLPDNFFKLQNQWERGKLSIKEFVIRTGMTESMLYRRLRKCRAVKGKIKPNKKSTF